MNNLEHQENECVALESILGSECFKCNNGSGFIKISVKIPHGMMHIMVEQELTNSQQHLPTVCHLIENLPPVTLNFTYCDAYPSDQRPDYTLSCIWLTETQMESLCIKLDELWEVEAGNVILFTWYEFLQNETLTLLNIESELKIKNELSRRFAVKKDFSEPQSTIANKYQSHKAVQDVQCFEEILPALLSYNEEKREESFNSTLFLCQICFEDKVGDLCSRFKECNHIYCKECLSEYFKVNIQDGSVGSIICPEPKCKTEALPHQVKQLVSDELYARYEKLLLQLTLDTMTDIIYCPLVHCQNPVIIEPDENLGRCPLCHYTFCVHCKLSYHGVSACKIASSEIRKILEEYMNGDVMRKELMEKKYGKHTIKRIIDDCETQKWFDNNSQKCPRCDAPIEKRDGCNKMTCYKCRAYFCWLCLQVLCHENPYRHFNNPKSGCFNRLFEGVEVLNDEFEFEEI